MKGFAFPKPAFAEALPWAGMFTPGVVIGTAGTLMSTYRIRGGDLTIAEPEAKRALAGIVGRTLRNLDDDWMLHVDVIRREGKPYPKDGAFPDPATALFDKERREQFGDDKRHLVTECFLTLTQALPSRKKSWLERMFVSGAPVSSEDFEVSLSRFEQQTESLMAGLQSVLSPQRLESEELAGYLRQCLTGVAGPVRLPEVPFYLAAYLSIPDVERGHDPVLDTEICPVLSLDHDGLPAMSSPSMLQFVMEIPVPMRFTVRWLPLGRLAAEREVASAEKGWYQGRLSLKGRLASGSKNKEVQEHHERLAKRGALTMAEDASKVGALIQSGLVGGGYISSSIVLRHETPSRAEEMAKVVSRYFQDHGFSARRETDGAYDVLLGSLPGNSTENVRKPFVTSVNATHFLPLHHPIEGSFRTDSPLIDAPPLFHAFTKGGAPYRGSAHVGGVGHILIAGKTGYGKSVFEGFLAASWLRYEDAQVFYFDKGSSQLALCRAVGGAYYQLGGESTLTFQPLADLDRFEEREWATDWLADLVRDARGDVPGAAPGPAERERLRAAVEMLAEMDRSDRTMTGLLPMVQDLELRKILSAYALPKDGSTPSAQQTMLDSSTEAFEDSHYHYFELEELLSRSQHVVYPVLRYLFHRIEQALDRRRPTLIMLDEAWQAIGYGGDAGKPGVFADQLIEWARTLRKKNAALVLATQAIGDFALAKSAKNLKENIPTTIYLPNETIGSSVEQHLAAGLTRREIDIIAGATANKDYYWHNPQGGRLIDLGLGPVGHALLCAEKDNPRIEELAAADENWFATWLKELGHNDWAERLATRTQRRVAR